MAVAEQSALPLEATFTSVVRSASPVVPWRSRCEGEVVDCFGMLSDGPQLTFSPQIGK
jgi:hypothetical protein